MYLGNIAQNDEKCKLRWLMQSKYILYFDDTGSRNPDAHESRHDGMNCFGLGGILVKEEDVALILAEYQRFCDEWRIDYPLHSTKIRGGQGKFGWLKKPENAGEFLPSLERFLLSLPIVGIACVIDRGGYLARYKDRHKDALWYMCKTAFCVLVERAAKFSDDRGRKLEICFEESGKKEDRDIIQYMRELKTQGNPFNPESSGNYAPLEAADYKRIILGEPRRKTKNLPLMQLADLILYPIAKAAYDPKYPPYKRLKDEKKLIDCLIPDEQIPQRGIKYSCFGDIKN